MNATQQAGYLDMKADESIRRVLVENVISKIDACPYCGDKLTPETLVVAILVSCKDCYQSHRTVSTGYGSDLPKVSLSLHKL